MKSKTEAANVYYSMTKQIYTVETLNGNREFPTEDLALSYAHDVVYGDRDDSTVIELDKTVVRPVK